jgi:hypothetical protein
MLSTRKYFLRFTIVIVTSILCLGALLIVNIVYKGVKLSNEAPFNIPPYPFDVNSLVGTWSTKYMGWGDETLIIQSDGKYKQIYLDNNINDGRYVFETPWNAWRVEQQSDRRIHLYLDGAKYFLEGVDAVDKTRGSLIPCPDADNPSCINGVIVVPFPAYDWIGDELVEMIDSLVLNVRMDSSGDIILVHLWLSSDRGFPILGGESEIYRKVK